MVCYISKLFGAGNERRTHRPNPSTVSSQGTTPPPPHQKSKPAQNKSPKYRDIDLPIEIDQEQTDGGDCGQWKERHPANRQRYSEWPREFRQPITHNDEREIDGKERQGAS